MDERTEKLSIPELRQKISWMNGIVSYLEHKQEKTAGDVNLLNFYKNARNGFVIRLHRKQRRLYANTL